MILSIIVPHFNQYHELKKLLRNLAQQTFLDFECIIIDDGSHEDRSVEINKLIATVPFPASFTRREHCGAPAARNAGFKKSTGKYILFTDADIIFKRHALATYSATLMNNPESSFAYAVYRYGFKKMRGIPFDSETLKKYNYIHTTSIIRREDFPGFDESLKKFQDWDLWLTMIENGKKGILIHELLYTIATRNGILSSWVPKFFFYPYILPMSHFLPSVRAYNRGREIIARKHHLPL